MLLRLPTWLLVINTILTYLANKFKRPWCWLKWPGLYGKGEERIRQNLRWDSVPYFLHLRYVYLWRTWCFAGHLFRELTVFNQVTYSFISFLNKFRCYFQSSLRLIREPKVIDHAGWMCYFISHKYLRLQKYFDFSGYSVTNFSFPNQKVLFI